MSKPDGVNNKKVINFDEESSSDEMETKEATPKDGKKMIKSMTENRLKKHQGRYVVFAATMKDLQRVSKTRVDVLDINFNAKFAATDFSEAALRGQ